MSNMNNNNQTFTTFACCKCNGNGCGDNGLTTVRDTYLGVGDSSFEEVGTRIIMYFTDMRPEYMTIGSWICDDCILELLYDGTLQFDYMVPWYDYQEPPTPDKFLGTPEKGGKLDLSKYKSPPYDYRKRLFRNYLRNDEYHSHCASDYDYPGIFKSNIEKIKMNPDLFGEYSRKVAKNL